MAAPFGNKFAKGGKRPGAGRPPEIIRKKCRELLHSNLPGLSKLAKTAVKDSDKLTAIGLLAKIGMPTQFENVGDTPAAIIWEAPALD